MRTGAEARVHAETVAYRDMLATFTFPAQRASDDDAVCGETIDHDEDVVYDDGETITWRCRRCGAEGTAPVGP